MSARSHAGGTPPSDEELERLLRDDIPPTADLDRRSALRAAFAAGFPRGSDASDVLAGDAPRSDSREAASGGSRSPGDARRAAGDARKAVGDARKTAGDARRAAGDPVDSPIDSLRAQGQLAPSARPEFRARLRGAFVAGARVSRAAHTDGEAAHPDRELHAGGREPRVSDVESDRVRGGPHAGRSRPRRDGRAGRESGGPTVARLLWLAGGLAAAALVLFLFRALSVERPAAEWLVRDLGPGRVLVDGRELLASRGDEIARGFERGARVEAVDGLLEMRRGELRLRLAPGTVLTGTDGGPASRLSLALEHGEVWILTGANYRGAGVRIATPNADVAVTGTALSVMASAPGTCVCVEHGRVEVTPRGGTDPPIPVEGGSMCFVSSAGEEPFREAFRAARGMDPHLAVHQSLLSEFAAEGLPR